jgi:3-oxocholest-4-en-26-oyl-CoA dehydrogenase beta subunit
MDFSYSEEQEAVRELAQRIFTERGTHERLSEVEKEADPRGPFDRSLWQELASAGLLGIGLPEDVGGAGLDFVSQCLVIEAAGTTAAHVPVLETMVLGAGTVDRLGTDEQRRRWLPGAADGSRVLTAATAELAGDLVVPGVDDPLSTAARRGDGTWELAGTKACVWAGLLADQVLVPVSLQEADGTPIGPGIAVVDAEQLRTGGSGDGGDRRHAQQPTTGRTQAVIELDGLRVGDDALLGGRGAEGRAALADLAERGTTALCVLEAGVCAAAVSLTAEYTKTREQFGKPIATFQAVGQRAADAYVDAEAVRLTAWQAAWRVSEGLPARAEVATAKYWAAEGGQRVVHAAAHLHGGVGVDRDYPLHRFFLLTEQVELSLGAAQQSLQRLGALLAAEPVDTSA